MTVTEQRAADTARDELDRLIAAARTPDGGWAYAPGKGSRVEPTAWIALGQTAAAAEALEWLAGAEGVDGWYADDRQAPVNYGFNGLVLLALLAGGRPSPAAERLTGLLLDVKGLAVPQSPHLRQDNSLQAWPWVGGTFSWVEPTAYCLLALKRAARCGVVGAADIASRVDEAERLLADRACAGGGWNYGNANVFGKDLRPHVPTTAWALLALQNRRDVPAVTTGLDFLSSHADVERSGLALALTVLCLRVLGRSPGPALPAAKRQAAQSGRLTNTVTLAALRLALAGETDVLRPFQV
jgi:hypothetical protein